MVVISGCEDLAWDPLEIEQYLWLAWHLLGQQLGLTEIACAQLLQQQQWQDPSLPRPDHPLPVLMRGTGSWSQVLLLLGISFLSLRYVIPLSLSQAFHNSASFS